MRGTRLLIGVVVFWTALSAACMGTTPSPHTSPGSAPEALTSDVDEPAANEGAVPAPGSEPRSATAVPAPGSAPAVSPSAASESQFAPPPSVTPAPMSHSLPAPASTPPPVEVTGGTEAADDLAPNAASAPASPTAADTTARLPAPRERPGLATRWGETRESHVRDVDFFRAEPSRPFAVAKIYYNDRAGVDALDAYHGGGPARPLELRVANGAVTVVLVDGESGSPLDAVRAGDRTYVVGEQGQRYGIRLLNRTGRRIEVVATVDGLDVIDGRPGSYDHRGYVLEPWETLDIDGFRRNEDEIAAFRFSRVSDSYAAQRGSARDVGVIGVAFFAERGDDWSSNELRIRDTARPFPRERRFAPPPDPM